MTAAHGRVNRAALYKDAKSGNVTAKFLLAVEKLTTSPNDFEVETAYETLREVSENPKAFFRNQALLFRAQQERGLYGAHPNLASAEALLKRIPQNTSEYSIAEFVRGQLYQDGRDEAFPKDDIKAYQCYVNASAIDESDKPSDIPIDYRYKIAKHQYDSDRICAKQYLEKLQGFEKSVEHHLTNLRGKIYFQIARAWLAIALEEEKYRKPIETFNDALRMLQKLNPEAENPISPENYSSAQKREKAILIQEKIKTIRQSQTMSRIYQQQLNSFYFPAVESGAHVGKNIFSVLGLTLDFGLTCFISKIIDAKCRKKNVSSLKAKEFLLETGFASLLGFAGTYIGKSVTYLLFFPPTLIKFGYHALHHQFSSESDYAKEIAKSLLADENIFRKGHKNAVTDLFETCKIPIKPPQKYADGTTHPNVIHYNFGALNIYKKQNVAEPSAPPDNYEDFSKFQLQT